MKKQNYLLSDRVIVNINTANKPRGHIDSVYYRGGEIWYRVKLDKPLFPGSPLDVVNKITVRGNKLIAG